MSGQMEKGYRAVLLWETTKLGLQEIRRSLDNRELFQERRLVTAALELVMEKPELREAWLGRVPEINFREAQLMISDDETTRRRDDFFPFSKKV